MSEVEKQEGQKTVVAFIAGLLIGGLLVWVFSASPESSTNENMTDETTTEQTTVGNNNEEASGDSDATNGNTQSTDQQSSAQESSEPVGEGEITISDQTAGPVVVLDSVTYPTNNGWVVVRDYEDGTPGNILGAARYSQEVGLTPTSVSLLRSTEAGTTYQVVFYDESGDRVFDLEDDVQIQGFSATFTAE